MTTDSQSGGVRIGNVSGSIYGSLIAGGDVHNVQLGSGEKTESVSFNRSLPMFQALRIILSTLYEVEADNRRIAADAGLDLTHITFGSSAANTWQNILVEAHKQNKIINIVLLAKEEYPAQGSHLVKAYESYNENIATMAPLENN